MKNYFPYHFFFNIFNEPNIVLPLLEETILLEF